MNDEDKKSLDERIKEAELKRIEAEAARFVKEYLLEHGHF